jgi:hypothetical protein
MLDKIVVDINNEIDININKYNIFLIDIKNGKISTI